MILAPIAARSARSDLAEVYEMQRIVVAFLGFSGSVLPVAHALETPEEGGWTGDVTLGYLRTTGNTDDTTADLDFTVALTVKPWGHELKGRAYGANKDDDTTAESYKLGWKSTYDFNEFDYAFGALDWNKDRFSGYSRQSFATAGYGRRILNTETYVLNAEIGVGYTKQRTVAVPGVPAVTEDGGAGTLGADFTWNISDTAAFEQTLYVFTASDNTFWESVSKLRTDVTGNIGLTLSYTVKQNTDVPVGTDKTDTLTSIGLNYGF